MQSQLLAHPHVIDNRSVGIAVVSTILVLFEQSGEYFELVPRQLDAIVVEDAFKCALRHESMAFRERFILLQAAENVFPFVGEFLAQARRLSRVLTVAVKRCRCDRVGALMVLGEELVLLESVPDLGALGLAGRSNCLRLVRPDFGSDRNVLLVAGYFGAFLYFNLGRAISVLEVLSGHSLVDFSWQINGRKGGVFVTGDCYPMSVRPVEELATAVSGRRVALQ